MLAKSKVNRVEKRWKRELRSLFAPILFASVIAIVFQSWEIGLMMTASLGFHELGHVAAIWMQGLDWELGFGPRGAWTRSSLKQRQLLSHYVNSIIHLAGPSFSLLLALTSLALFFLMESSSQRVYWLLLANLNALLALLNFIPMGNLTDGGKFIKRLFASLPEHEEKRLLTLLIPSLFSWAVLLYGLDLVRALSLGTLVLWLMVSMVIESTQDDPSEAQSERAMTIKQANILTSVVVMMFIYSIGIVLITPFWLTKSAVLKMAEGWITLLAYIIWKSPMVLRVGLAALGVLFGFWLIRYLIEGIRSVQLEGFWPRRR